MFSCFRTSPIKDTITTLALVDGWRKAILSWATVKYSRYIDGRVKVENSDCVTSVCLPRLVLPVGGRVRGWMVKMAMKNVYIQGLDRLIGGERSLNV